MTRILLAGLALVACSCSSDKKAPDSAGEVAGAWREAGLTVSDFTAVKSGDLGGECAAGKVDAIEVTLCRYADEAAAEKAQPAGLKKVGDTTGSSVASGRFLLVVADRDKADPEGKVLNQIIQTFRGRAVLVPPERGTVTKPAGG